MKKERLESEADYAAHFADLGRRIAKFPPWMRIILLQDINTAIESRIAVFEMIEHKVKA